MENNLAGSGQKIFFLFRTLMRFKFRLSLLKLFPLLESCWAEFGNVPLVLSLWEFGFLELKQENILSKYEKGSNIYLPLAVSYYFVCTFRTKMGQTLLWPLISGSFHYPRQSSTVLSNGIRKGFTIFGFNFTSGALTIIKWGNFNLNIRFKTPLAQATNIIAYPVLNSTLSINNNGEVLCHEQWPNQRCSLWGHWEVENCKNDFAQWP